MKKSVFEVRVNLLLTVTIPLFAFLAVIFAGCGQLDATASEAPATIQTPAPGSTITGSSVTFTWNNAGASLYQVWIGTCIGAYNIGAYPLAGTTGLTTTTTGLPTNGSLLYVRMWSLINGTWCYKDYTYNNTGPATIETPAPGSTITGSSVTFTWSNAGASLYQVWIGTCVGAYNIGEYPRGGTTGLTTTATGLPTNGSLLYVRMWSLINGTWCYNDYTWKSSEKIMNVITVSTKIVSDVDSLPNITVGKITFETSDDCTTSVEVGGKQYDAGTGVSHEAYIHATTNPLGYTIHARTFDGIESVQSELLNVDSSMKFAYHGEVGAYLDYLVPVVIYIYETYLNYSDVLDVTLLFGIDYFSLFQKENIFSLQEKTTKDLYNSFNIWFKENRSVLKAAWPLFSDDQLKVVSILNAVSYLWRNGNYQMIYRTGCVQVNELITADSADFIYPDGLEPPLYWKTSVGMTGFVNSKIGCCTDQAFLTKALLEEAGFESRRVLLPWHWMTEVFIDSSWYTIDAMGGVMVNASTESMVEGIKRKVYLFFTPYMDFDSANYYASSLYPWFPTVSFESGFDGGITDKSQFQVITGYYDIPPWQNELSQINGY